MSRRKLTVPAAREIDHPSGGLIPEMTDALALVYAKLLAVGCPPVRAVIYCAPQLQETDTGREMAKRIAHQWTHDASVLAAMENINGGKWQELPIEVRCKLALQKSTAEAAFFLWTASLVEADSREQLDKMKLTRDILKAELGQQPDETDPMAAFARLAMEITKNAMATKAAAKEAPIQVQSSGLDALLAKAKVPDHTM